MVFRAKARPNIQIWGTQISPKIERKDKCNSGMVIAFRKVDVTVRQPYVLRQVGCRTSALTEFDDVIKTSDDAILAQVSNT